MKILGFYSPIGKTGDFTMHDTVFHWDAEAHRLSFHRGDVEVVLGVGYKAPKTGFWDGGIFDPGPNGYHVTLWLDGIEFGDFWDDTRYIRDDRLRKTVEFGLSAWSEQVRKSKAESLAKLPE